MSEYMGMTDEELAEVAKQLAALFDEAMEAKNQQREKRPRGKEPACCTLLHVAFRTPQICGVRSFSPPLSPN
jgi:hypothetical protein